MERGAKKDVRAMDAVKLSKARQITIHLGLHDLCKVRSFEIRVNLLDKG